MTRAHAEPEGTMSAVPPLDCLAYRVPQAAKLLNISPRQVWLMIQQGRIKARKLGKCTLILREELEAELQRRAQDGAKATAPPKPAVHGTIYVLLCMERVKIGFTRGPVAKRVVALKTGAPETITILREIAAERSTERVLHARFEKWRCSGEWFWLRGAVARWINQGCPL